MASTRTILLLTRPRPQSERFAAALAGHLGDSVDILIAPIFRIEHRQTELSLAGVGGLIFTSQNGVDAFADLTDDRTRPVYCVGARTAAKAAEVGLTVKVVEQNADALVNRLIDQKPGGALLHLRGEHARGDIANRLTQGGQPCAEQVLYDQVAQPPSAQAMTVLSGDRPVLIPLFSPRTATLVSEAAENATAPLAIATLSDAVTQAWTGPSPTILVQADRPDGDAMLTVVLRLNETIQRLESRGGAG